MSNKRLTVSELLRKKLKEEMAMSVGSGAVAGMPTKDAIPPVPAGVTTGSKMLRRASPTDIKNGIKRRLFAISGENFNRVLLRKEHYSNISNYDDLDTQITEYVESNPNVPVLVENTDTGAIIYLRYAK